MQHLKGHLPLNPRVLNKIEDSMCHKIYNVLKVGVKQNQEKVMPKSNEYNHFCFSYLIQ